MNTIAEFLKMIFWLTLAGAKITGIAIAIVVLLGVLWVFLGILIGLR